MGLLGWPRVLAVPIWRYLRFHLLAGCLLRPVLVVWADFRSSQYFRTGPYWGPDYGYRDYYGYDGGYGYADVPDIYYYRGDRSYTGGANIGASSSQRRFAAITPAEREELQADQYRGGAKLRWPCA